MEPDAFTRQPVGGRLKSDWLLRQVCFGPRRASERTE